MKPSPLQKVASILGLIELALLVPCLIVLLQALGTSLRSPNSLKSVAALVSRFAVQQQPMNPAELDKLSKLLSANAELLFWSLIGNVFLLVLMFCSGSLLVRVKALGPVLGAWRSSVAGTASDDTSRDPYA